jgi:hypothetical protein
MVQRAFADNALKDNTKSVCGLDASVVIPNIAKFRFDTMFCQADLIVLGLENEKS